MRTAIIVVLIHSKHSTPLLPTSYAHLYPPPPPLRSNTPNPSIVTPLPFLNASPGTLNPIFSFPPNCLATSACLAASASASLRDTSRYLFLSSRAFCCNSPNGSNRSLPGSLNGFLTQLPRSVSVVERGRPARTSYALLSGGSAKGLGVGSGGGTRDLSRSVDTVSGRVYGPAPKSVSLRSVERVRCEPPPKTDVVAT